jgi:hypothetical protein
MKIDAAFVLLIFCVFAASVFLVLMLVGNIYQKINDTARTGQNERIALSYLRGKIRNGENIFIEEFHGLSAIAFEENIDGSIFITRIYSHDGWLRELFYQREENFLPQAGVRILRVGSLFFEEIENGLLRISTDHGSLVIAT